MCTLCTRKQAPLIPFRTSLRISLLISAAMCGCSGEYDPCRDIQLGTECQHRSDCSYVTDCWCGFCIPEICTGKIEFASSILEGCIRRTTGKSNGSLRYEDVRGITHIDGCGGYDRWVTSLWGIQCLMGLERLDLFDNLVNDLEPISGLHRLTHLNLELGQLVDIDPISNLANLRELNLSYNLRIVDISPIASLASLEVVELSHNEIDRIDSMAGLLELDYVDLYSNKVTDIGPLVDNSGVGEGDQVFIKSNPLDCTVQASNIQTLRDRGVVLDTSCP